MSMPWGKKLSIIIFPEGDFRNQVLDEMNSWLESKLTSPCIWVYPEEVDFEANPPVIMGNVHATDIEGIVEEREVIITDILASQEYDLIRVISLVSAASSVELDDAIKSQYKIITDSIFNSAAGSPRETISPDIRRNAQLLRINLVIAPTSFDIDDLFRNVQTAGHVNVLVSSEDRSTPWSGDSYVRDDEKLPKFVASHLISASGSWNGIDIGLFDNSEDFQPGEFYVSRLFVNSVLTDGLARRISAQVLEEAANPINSGYLRISQILPDGYSYIDDEEANQHIEYLLKITQEIQSGALSFTPADKSINSGVIETSEKQILGYFWDFAKAKFLSIPKLLFRAIRNKLRKKLNEELSGDSGIFRISQLTDNLDSFDRALIEKAKNIEELKESATLALIAPHRYLGQSDGYPKLWRGIRKIIFGSLDASDFSEFGQGETKKVFKNVDAILQDPNKIVEIRPDVSELTGIQSLDWENLERTNEVLAGYENVAQLFRDEMANKLVEKKLLLENIEYYENLSEPVPVNATPNVENLATSPGLEIDEDIERVEKPSSGSFNSPGWKGLWQSGAAEEQIVEPVEIDESQNEELVGVEHLALDIEEEVQPKGVFENEPPVNYVQPPTKEELNEWRKRIHVIDQEYANLEDSLISCENEASEISHWAEANNRSYLWRLLQLVSSNIQRAEDELGSYKTAVETINIPSTKPLIEAEGKFASNLFRVFAGWFALLAIVVLSLFTTNPGPVQIALVAVALLIMIPKILGIMVSGKRIVGILVIIILASIIGVITNSGNIVSEFLTWLSSLWLGWIILTLVTVIVTGLISTMSVYYKSWNQYRMSVVTAISELENVANGVTHTRNERDRLTSLYRQLKEWLFIIGYVVNKPWKINSLWLGISGDIDENKEFPFSLRLAQAREDDQTQIAGIKDLAAAYVLKRGWRESAYASQIDVIKKRLPASLQSKYALEAIDSDSSSGTGSLRKILLSELTKDDSVALAAANKQMWKLREYVQSQAIRDSAPRVVEIRNNPLSDLNLDILDHDEDLGQNWDEFLSHSIPSGHPASPLSVDRFHSDAVVKQRNYQVKSLVIGPDRLVNPLGNNEYIKAPYDSSKRLPLDLVIRMDFVPINARDVNVKSALNAIVVEPEYSQSDVEESGA